MKRVLIILCCICLIVCLAVPAFAAMKVDWIDYVVSTTPGIQFDINDVFIPSSVTGARWRYILNGSTIETVNNTSYSFTVSNSTDNLWFDLVLQSVLDVDITDIDNQDSLDFYFRVNGPDVSGIKFSGRIIYYDSSGSVLLNTPTPVSTLDSFGAGVLSVDLSSAPDGAVLFSTTLTYKFSGAVPGDYTIDYVGLGFEVLSPGTLTRPTPITIHPQDYIVNESSNGDTSTLYVSVPSSDLNIGWNTLRNDDFSALSEFYGNPYNVDLPVADCGYWIGCHVFDKLDITDIVNGSTLEVDFNIDYPSAVAVPYGFPVRYQVRYFDVDGHLLDTVRFFSLSGNYGFDNTSLNLVIDKPEGAVSMTFLLQYMDIPVTVSPYEFTLELKSVNFVCDIPTMVRVQQETGRTNKLLEKIIDGWDPSPSLPPFNDSMQDSLDKEDQIIDQLDPDGVIGDLDAIQVTVLDRILLLANSFQMISLIFQAFLKVPVLEIIAYISLLLGLLASLLGIGIAAGRAASRHEGRSGKKGK